MKISSNNEDSLSAWTQHAEQWTLGVISVLNPSVCRVHLCFVSDGGCPVYYNLLLPRRIFSAWENRSSDWVFHHRETDFTVTQSQHNHSTDSAEAVRKFSWFVHVQLKEEVLQVIKQSLVFDLTLMSQSVWALTCLLLQAKDRTENKNCREKASSLVHQTSNCILTTVFCEFSRTLHLMAWICPGL